MNRSIITFILIGALFIATGFAQESEPGLQVSLKRFTQEPLSVGQTVDLEAAATCYGGYCGPVELSLLYCPALDCYDYREILFDAGDVYFNESDPSSRFWDVKQGDEVTAALRVVMNNSGIFRLIAAARIGESDWVYSEPVALKAGVFGSLSSVSLPENVNSSFPEMVMGPSLFAYAGGPYSQEVGREVVLDGSNSSGSVNIASYHWDYGDGEEGSGIVVRHVYKSIKVYTVTLTVTDDSGNTASNSNAVNVYPVDLMVNIDVSPKQERYDYGDLVSDIAVTVSRIDGTPVEGATLSGVLSGKENKAELSFQYMGGGKYHAPVSYPILKVEADYLDVFIKATDSFGNTGIAIDKLMLMPKNTSFQVLVQEPYGSDYARGQRVPFEVRVMDIEGKDLRDVNVTLIEGWTNRKIPMEKKNEVYNLVYEIPRTEKKHLSFLVLAAAYVGGKRSTAVSNADFDLTGKLDVVYISPDAMQARSEVRLVRLNITYPNGEVIGDDKVNGLLNDRPIVLERDGDTFAAPVSLGPDENSLSTNVKDSSGNTGEAEMLLSPVQGDSFAFPGLEVIFLIFVTLVLVAFALSYYGRSRVKEDLKKQYEDLKQRRQALKKLMKNIMHEYYTRKISSEDARKRMLDYEKELILEREKMRTVLQKLGIKKMEAEGKEELIEWLVEKLQDGEDPELLKEGLSDAGIDPKIVNNIRKHLI